jgi:hypothetical protein
MRKKQTLSARPDWPALVISEEGGWCQVHGEHDTHFRLQIAEFIRLVLFLACLLGWFFWLGSPNGLSFTFLAAVTVFLLFDKSSLHICMTLFPKETNIVIEHDTITINGKSYEITPQMETQFRAGEKFLNERQEQRVRQSCKRGELSPLALHKIGYRKIEMIYGDNVELITVISDPQKAGNFASTLQRAWDQSRLFHPEKRQQTTSSRVE